MTQVPKKQLDHGLDTHKLLINLIRESSLPFSTYQMAQLGIKINNLLSERMTEIREIQRELENEHERLHANQDQ
jgi:hypothetical protein